MITHDHIKRLATNVWTRGPWWERAAADAMMLGRALIIPTRQDAGVYLVRSWLSTPIASAYPDGGERLESGDSVLLHFFARGDDDASLHDHPWDFRATILVGGYTEHLPPLGWRFGAEHGPAWDEYTADRREGDVIDRLSTDLHCVGAVVPGTWTLVRTGPRVRSWGFHPPGKPWVGYRDYLGLSGAAA